jgi:hypothetical protein
MKSITIKQAHKAVDFINEFFEREIMVDADILHLINPVIARAYSVAIEEIRGQLKGSTSLDSILDYVCRSLKTTPEEIMQSQTHDNVFARQVYFYAATKLLPKKGYVRIAKRLGMHHASVITAKKKLLDVTETKDKRYYPELKRILDGLAIPLPGQTRSSKEIKSHNTVVYINNNKATRLYLDAITTMAG